MVNDPIVEFDEIHSAIADRVGRGWVRLLARREALCGLGVDVPRGFVITREAIDTFFSHRGLRGEIARQLIDFIPLAPPQRASLGKAVRARIVEHPLQESLREALMRHLDGHSEAFGWVAVHAWTEPEDDGLDRSMLQATVVALAQDHWQLEGAIKEAVAGLFEDDAIGLRTGSRNAQDFDAALVSVQDLGAAEPAASGTMFLCDPASGFRDVISLEARYGLPGTNSGGERAADRYVVSKRALQGGRPAVLQRDLPRAGQTGPGSGRGCVLDTDEIELLARVGLEFDDPLKHEVSIDWIQRAERTPTIMALRPAFLPSRKDHVIERYARTGDATVLVTGRAITATPAVVTGVVSVLDDVPADAGAVAGRVVVTDMVDFDWEPMIKGAVAIITNRGGRTAEGAVIARSMGIPAVVGCGSATTDLANDMVVTVSTAEGGTGFVYSGAVDFKVTRMRSGAMPAIPVNLLLRCWSPNLAFDFARIPNAGAGPVPTDYIVRKSIGIHPMAAVAYPELAGELKLAVEVASAGYGSPRDFYFGKLVEGISTIAAAFWPLPVLMCLSNSSSDMWRKLTGGAAYEQIEVNPMLGLRGASRHASSTFAAAFALECEALRRVRTDMGFTNVEILVPFARTLQEAGVVLQRLGDHGLARGARGLRVHLACDLPIHAMAATQFIELFDGMWIDARAVYQLLIGIDEDACDPLQLCAPEANEAFRQLIATAVGACRGAGKYAGYCVDSIADYPARGEGLSRWLVDIGVNGVAVLPDDAEDFWLSFAALQRTKPRAAAAQSPAGAGPG